MDRPFVLFGSKPVVGWIRGGVLHARKRLFYRNSFQTTVRAELESSPQGTLVRYRFQLNQAVVWFTRVWLALVVGVGGGVVVVSSMAKAAHGDGRAWLGILVPVGLLVFQQLLMRFCRVLARGEDAFLLSFLQTTLQAKQLPEVR